MSRCWTSFKTGAQSFWKSSAVQAAVFFVLTALLPGIDILTDCLTASDLYSKEQIRWCLVSVFWILCPFLLHLFIFIQNCTKKPDELNANFCKVILHLPFFLPLTNTLLSFQLAITDLNNPENAKNVEMIKKSVGMTGLYEAFLESGPQLLTQIHIISCTGEISPTQMVSISVSLLTLTLAACKAFFVQRDFAQADPSPSPHMLLRVFPLMLIVIINGVLQWTIIGGLLKEFVFLAIFLVFTSTWICIRLYRKCCGKGDDMALRKSQEGIKENKLEEGKHQKSEKKESKTGDIKEKLKYQKNKKQESESGTDDGDITKQILKDACYLSLCCAFIPLCFPCYFCCCKKIRESKIEKPKPKRLTGNMAKITEDTEEQKTYFPLKAAMTSVWVPAIIGDLNYSHTYIISAFTSLAFRSLCVLGAIVWSASNYFPDFLQGRTYLFHCIDNVIQERLNISENAVCDDLYSCFFKNKTDVIQIHRKCGEDETMLQIFLICLLILQFVLTATATFCLFRLSKYQKLYEISRSCVFPCITSPMDPIIHRTLIFQFIRDENRVKLAEVVNELSKIDNIQTSHHSESKEEVDGIDFELKPLNIKNGASLIDRQSSNGESPLNFALQRKDTESVNLLVSAGAAIIPDSSKIHPITIALQNNDNDNSIILAKHASGLGDIGKALIVKWCQMAIKNNDNACLEIILKRCSDNIYDAELVNLCESALVNNASACFEKLKKVLDRMPIEEACQYSVQNETNHYLKLLFETAFKNNDTDQLEKILMKCADRIKDVQIVEWCQMAIENNDLSCLKIILKECQQKISDAQIVKWCELAKENNDLACLEIILKKRVSKVNGESNISGAHIIKWCEMAIKNNDLACLEIILKKCVSNISGAHIIKWCEMAMRNNDLVCLEIILMWCSNEIDDAQIVKWCEMAVENNDCACLEIMLKKCELRISNAQIVNWCELSLVKNDLTSFDILKRYTNLQIKEACELSIENNKPHYLKYLLDHQQGYINYTSTSLLGSSNKKVVQNFSISGDGFKNIRSITVNKNKYDTPIGIEIVWSDKSKETVGRSEEADSSIYVLAKILDRSEVLAPQGGHFTFIRGRSNESGIIRALAFDTVSSGGVQQEGNWIGYNSCGAENEKTEHSLKTLDRKDINITCILDGFSGQLVEYRRDNGSLPKFANLTVNYALSTAVNPK